MALKGLFYTSLLVLIIALFCTLDIFTQQRNAVLKYVPLSAKLYLGLSGNGAKSKKDEPELMPYNVILKDTSIRLMTKEELADYDGSDGSQGLYLAILGRVYDVSKGHDHYLPGKGYGFFAARDGTRAFVTGDFTDKGLKDNVDGFNGEQMLEIENWIKFYDNTYTLVGKLVGNFYDSRGRPTQALRDAQKGIVDGVAQKRINEEDKRKFPGCNSQTAKNSGTKVWCTPKSGGIKREEAGVPRKYYRPGNSKPRCACIRTTGPQTGDPDGKGNRGDLDNPLFEVYEGCDPMSASCHIIPS